MNEISLPIKCEQCHKDTYLFLNDFQIPVFVICQHCGYETSHVFCPDCEIGGDFIGTPALRPETWQCPECQKSYHLPTNYYQTPTFTSSESHQNLDVLIFQEHLNIEFLHDGKEKCPKLMGGSILGVSFASFLPFLVAIYNNASLWPLGLMILLGVALSIFVCIKHTTMTWENFEKLSVFNRKKRMFYDSYWWYLHRSGLLVILSMPLIWMVLIFVSNFKTREPLDKFLILPILVIIITFLLAAGAKTLSRSRKQYRKWQQLNELT